MTDIYQPIYDAMRSRISNGDIGGAVSEAARQAFDISFAVDIVKNEFCFAAAQMARPSVLYRPTLSADGNQWCALLGEDLQIGIAGFGDTPADAMTGFDEAFNNARAGLRPDKGERHDQ